MAHLAVDQVIGAGEDDRRGLFNTTAARLGTTPQNVEKDFWVCWTLDQLFNRLPAGGPRLLFKGGTSLSKGFGLIARFSEDIDVTVFRDDLGEGESLTELDALSGKKRKAWLENLSDVCAGYIQGRLRGELEALTAATVERLGLPAGALRIAEDPADRLNLRVVYPSALAADAYIAGHVTIESGARSALDPNAPLAVTPYLAAEVADLDLTVANVTTVDPERTFWDKVLILHGLRAAFDSKGVLRGEGQRVSRHYYDLHRLVQSDRGERALADQVLAENCALHARLFFNRPDANLAAARPPTYGLVPHDEMTARLAKDYDLMARMIFGTPPAFEDVLASIVALEARLNATPAS
ncbi:nucleotidyl transferase AbiEii/AbiGii toxin family protein [Caulobacter rhizosphaerae]|uniref:nucleotidyl transferase AbiEii/AbiGii toxin family protein n=1 Tax=Caulobacter rhizosphaerae TaxID=2010972 RepID=UPI0013D6781B|nr:nucleotidyl transferase AbiEii/AbiGii toxin family protein [Caulobacter rhizosphaerae]GGL35516.1 hypothetical protein GCM10010983_35610 [Caulobacter rhizosphaerae]